MPEIDVLVKWVESIGDTLQRQDSELAAMRKTCGGCGGTVTRLEEQLRQQENDITVIFKRINEKVEEKKNRGFGGALGYSLPPSVVVFFALAKLMGWL